MKGTPVFFVTLLHGKKHFDKDPQVTVIHPQQSTTPVNKPPAARETVETAPSSLPVNRQHTILIVEDNPELRGVIRQQLETGYHIQQAADGLQGWELATENIPDLIISDVMMPNISGTELCTRLKTDPRTSHIPVILLTAKSTQADQITGLEQGADSYITKPFSTKILELHIRNLLEARRRLQQRTIREFTLRMAQPAPEETSAVRSRIDSGFLNTVIELIDSHLEDTGFGVEKLSRKVGMSPPILYKKLRALTDMSVNEFIKTRRFKKAAELILQKELTINEISFAVGYEDRKYFSREFKKYFGVAPSDFNQHTLEQPHKPLNKNQQEDRG